METLRELIANSEDELISRVLEYAKQNGYTMFTSTLKEAWRASIWPDDDGLCTCESGRCRRHAHPPDSSGPGQWHEADG